mmetsp:Transcript_32596/g.62953  ORF Transcript_32596/g.62953 Transcript_32596/m.62953 type:complete len:85 (-) Transcript_32596:15-269(-)
MHHCDDLKMQWLHARMDRGLCQFLILFGKLTLGGLQHGDCRRQVLQVAAHRQVIEIDHLAVVRPSQVSVRASELGKSGKVNWSP